MNVIGWVRTSGTKRHGYIGISILLLCILFTLRTRSVFVSFLIFTTITIFFVIVNRFKIKIRKSVIPILFGMCIVFVVTIITLGYAPDIASFLELKAGSKTGTLAERLSLWDKTSNLINNNLFLGVGAGHWKIELPGIGFEGLQRASQGNYFFARPHNDWLQILSETGILGFAIWIGIWLTSIQAGLSRLKGIIPKQVLITHALALSGLLGFALFSMMSFPLERIEFAVFLSLYFAILTHKAAELKTTRKSSWHTITFAIIIVVLITNTILGATRIQKERQAYYIEQALNTGHYDSANKVLENLHNPFFTITPNGTPTHFYEGALQLQKKQYDNAEDSFKESLKVSPYHLASHSNLALTYASQGKNEKAISQYLKALEISPNAQEVLLQISLVYIKVQDKENAFLYAAKLNENHPKKYDILEKVYGL